MRYIKTILMFLAAGLALAPCAHAQIGYLDGPSFYYNATTHNTTAFPVSSGASVLVVCIGYRSQGSALNPNNPSNVQWNGNALTLAVAGNTHASTYDYNLIYYLTNPPPGSGSVTCILSNIVSQTWWMAYTLTNVNVTNALLTGSVYTSAGASINNTITDVAAGDWAAVSASTTVSGSSASIISATGGTVLTAANTSSGNCTMIMGSVSNLPAGPVQFVETSSGSSTKLVLVEAIFTSNSALPPPPIQNLTWVGDGSANNWDTTSANWAGATNVFAQGDYVTFGDSGSCVPDIYVVSSVQPGSMTISNSANYYIFDGAGIILTSNLTKLGANEVDFTSSANSFSGPIVIQAGTLSVGSPANGGASGTLGGGPITNNGCTGSVQISGWRAELHCAHQRLGLNFDHGRRSFGSYVRQQFLYWVYHGRERLSAQRRKSLCLGSHQRRRNCAARRTPGSGFVRRFHDRVGAGASQRQRQRIL